MASIASAALRALAAGLAVSWAPIVPPVWPAPGFAAGVAGVADFSALATVWPEPVPQATMAPPTAVSEAARRNARRLVGASARVASVSSCEVIFDMMIGLSLR